MNTANTLKLSNNTLGSNNVFPLELDQVVEPTSSDAELRIQRLVNNQLRQQLRERDLQEKKPPLASLPRKTREQIKIFPELKKRYKRLSKNYSEAKYKIKLLKVELNELKASYAKRVADDKQPEDSGAISLAIADQLRSLQNSQDQLIHQQRQENQFLEALKATENNQIWHEAQYHMPKESGIYLLTNGIRQCVGYYNSEAKRFSSTTFFNQPTHWMPQPKLPAT